MLISRKKWEEKLELLIKTQKESNEYQLKLNQEIIRNVRAEGIKDKQILSLKLENEKLKDDIKTLTDDEHYKSKLDSISKAQDDLIVKENETLKNILKSVKINIDNNTISNSFYKTAYNQAQESLRNNLLFGVNFNCFLFQK